MLGEPITFEVCGTSGIIVWLISNYQRKWREQSKYSKLEEDQLRSVVDVLSGRNAFFSFPTEYGKLCYAILPCAFDELRSTDKKSIVSES